MNSERVQMTDPKTGIRITQITSYPTPSEPMAYDWPGITPDNRRVIFRAQRWSARDAPWDLFRCDVDGLDLFRLTKRAPECGRISACLSADGQRVFAAWSNELLIRAIDMETGRTEVVADLSMSAGDLGKVAIGLNCELPDHRILLGLRSPVRRTTESAVLDLRTGHLALLGDDTVPYGFDFLRNGPVVIRNQRRLTVATRRDGSRAIENTRPEPQKICRVTMQGQDEVFIATTEMFGHSTMLGCTGLVQGTGKPPHRCVWLADEGRDPWKLVQGPYFWHSGASFDGEWIIADTNWPDEGLQLVHVATGNRRTLCHAGATQGQPNFGHAHPSLSRDGRVCVFGSDRTGIQQVYVAHITEEFRDSVIEGELDSPRNKRVQSMQGQINGNR
ncbi:MAG: hypothetical protein BWY06_01741 [Candidatus Latescibacteria bacterium ADurb.Bin168]|nr:MAG: hypothetical protein BWY06_01741 [Candidatus Latescibacteria bacterium ADurb.Bin168]